MTDGRTGPIARGVMRAIERDLGLDPDSLFAREAVGSTWFANVATGFPWFKHMTATSRERIVVGPRAAREAYEQDWGLR